MLLPDSHCCCTSAVAMSASHSARVPTLLEAIPRCGFQASEEPKNPCGSSLVKPKTLVQRNPPLPEDSVNFKLQLASAATLRTAELREAVKLPRFVEEKDWIASQAIRVNEEIVKVVNILGVTGLCRRECCPTMSAGRNIVYRWKDGPHDAPREIPAQEYMRMIVDSGHETLVNIVPRDGGPYPKDFMDQMRTLHRRSFRVFAHAYLDHIDDFAQMEAEAHLNCCFKQFLFFVQEFDLVSRDDMKPLETLIAKFETSDFSSL